MIRAGVLVERHDNVITLSFGSAAASLAAELEDDSWWPWAEEATTSRETPAATRLPLPVRGSPQPLHVGRRLARSEFVADLREHGWLIGLVAAAVLCTWLTP